MIHHLSARYRFIRCCSPPYPLLLLYSDKLVDVTPIEVRRSHWSWSSAIAAVLLAVLARLLRLVASGRPDRRFHRSCPSSSQDSSVDQLEPGSWPDDFLLRLHLTVVAVAWLAIAALGVYVALKLGSRLSTVTQAAEHRLGSPARPGHRPRSRRSPGGRGPTPDRGGHHRVATDRGRRPYEPKSEPRDIYHLVFDRYGSERSLALGPGIDNSEFVGWLRERGFQVVDDARANFERTALSLSAVHDMSLHEDLASSERAGYDAARRSHPS